MGCFRITPNSGTPGQVGVMRMDGGPIYMDANWVNTNCINNSSYWLHATDFSSSFAGNWMIRLVLE